MTPKEELGPSNWDLLLRAPLTIWLGVSGVTTIHGSLRKEAAAFDDALAEGARRFDHNKLIVAVVAEAKRPSENQKRGKSITTSQQALEQLRHVCEVLSHGIERSVAKEFTSFLLDIGWTVARASAESPLAGCKVSVEEEQFLYAAGDALGGLAD